MPRWKKAKSKSMDETNGGVVYSTDFSDSESAIVLSAPKNVGHSGCIALKTMGIDIRAQAQCQ
jgi:hypothetical protein